MSALPPKADIEFGFAACHFDAKAVRRWRLPSDSVRNVPVPDGAKSEAMICARNIAKPIYRRQRMSPLPQSRTPTRRRVVSIGRYSSR